MLVPGFPAPPAAVGIYLGGRLVGNCHLCRSLGNGLELGLRFVLNGQYVVKWVPEVLGQSLVLGSNFGGWVFGACSRALGDLMGSMELGFGWKLILGVIGGGLAGGGRMLVIAGGL
eukprot:4634476-Ditylum_brightwellii.AAC.1